jgi:arylsulfatase A-like enzyme
MDNTLVIVTSDHGEAFGEHGDWHHGRSVHQPESRVPLIIFGPGVPASRVVETPVSLRDVPATIMGLAGFGTDSPLAGSSLAASWSADDPPAGVARPVLMENRGASTFPTKGRQPRKYRIPMAGVVDGDLVYLRRWDNGQEELYDLAADPTEEKDLAGDPAQTKSLDRLRAEMQRLGCTPMRQSVARTGQPPAAAPGSEVVAGRAADGTTPPKRLED